MFFSGTPNIFVPRVAVFLRIVIKRIVILKDFLRKPPSNQSDSFEHNYKFFNHDGFKNDLKNIPWQNILSRNNISVSMAFDVFFSTTLILYLTNMHHYINFTEKSLKTKPWIYKRIQFLIKKRDELFELYFDESDPILKATKRNNFKIACNSVIS